MKLLIYRGDALERTVDLTDRDLRIGRGVENDVVLEDPEKTVSRFHAELRQEQGAYVLFDLNSQNGTWIDGQRIQRQPLNPGQTALLGNFRIVLDAATALTAEPGTAPNLLAPTVMLNRDAAAAGAAPAAGASHGAPAAGASAGAAAASASASASAAPPAPANIPRRPKLAPTVPDEKKGIATIPRPMFYGSALLVMVLIIGVMYVMRPRPPQQEPEQASQQPQQQASQPASDPNAAQGQAQPQTPATASTSTSTPTDPSTPETNDQIVARYVKDGRARLDAGDYAGAVDAFNRALRIDPSHADALDLKMKAEEARHQQQQQAQSGATSGATAAGPATGATTTGTTASTGEKSAASGATAGTSGGLGPMRGIDSTPSTASTTSTAAAAATARKERAAREAAAALQRRYTQAKAELTRGDYEHAIPDFEALQRDKPGYQDVATLLDQAKAARHTDATRAMAQAQTLAAKGEFASAIREYEHAAKIDPSTPGTQDGIAAVRKQMHDAGEQAYRRARQLDAVGRTQDALPLYQRAVDLLPADDPSGKAARDRLDALKSQGQP